ncbi:hypothetical protein E8E15_000397 [Penicillium rubens]|nr:hypothetical protein E8E15_000397 [Penicillium rubens]
MHQAWAPIDAAAQMPPTSTVNSPPGQGHIRSTVQAAMSPTIEVEGDGITVARRSLPGLRPV